MRSRVIMRRISSPHSIFSAMKTSEFNKLKGLLAGYFHQDWALDFASADDVLRTIRREVPPDDIRKACTEIEEVLAQRHGIRDPEAFLWEVLDCNYSPRHDGFTVAEWLGHVRGMLACP